MNFACARDKNKGKLSSVDILYTNIRSLKNKVVDLQYEISRFQNFPIVLLTETWLDCDISNSLFSLCSSFQIVCCDHEEKKGGGLLAAVPLHFHVYSPPSSIHKSPALEALWWTCWTYSMAKIVCK